MAETLNGSRAATNAVTLAVTTTQGRPTWTGYWTRAVASRMAAASAATRTTSGRSGYSTADPAVRPGAMLDARVGVRLPGRVG